MDRLQLYKELSDREWGRQAHLLRVMNLCMVAATVLGTALVAVLQGFDYGSGLRMAFLGFAGLAGLALACSLYYIGRALLGRGYFHLPKASVLEQHYTTLRDWHGAGGDPAGAAASAFGEYIASWLIAAADRNSAANERVSSFVRNALASIAVSLTFLAIAAILYLWVQLN